MQRIFIFIISIILGISLCACQTQPKSQNQIVAPGYSQHAVIIFESNSGN